MTRVVTFGRMPTEPPKFTLTEVHFPELARLDEGTKEGFISRVLTSEGGSVRDLPRTIFAQFKQEGGHMGSEAVGGLHEVTLDGETGVLSGKGFLVDSDAGRQAAIGIASQTLFHNSVDLAEVKIDFIEHGDFWDDDFQLEVRFTEWKLAATTIVGVPAFANAHAVLPDEIQAAIEAGPLVAGFSTHDITLQANTPEEITAADGSKPAWDLFHRPEPTKPHKIIVGEPDENGWVPVFGHLSLWGTCHDGIEAQCVMTPRPLDNYASFNKPSVLTDRGQVEAGPIVLFGGHIPLHKAADDPANAWADVRVTPGVHGPWLSGVVRPHVALDDAKVYVARASRISGHWKTGRLKMIVCCNAEGFDVPGSGDEVAASVVTNAHGDVVELVASFPECASDSEQPEPATELDQERFGQWVTSLQAIPGGEDVAAKLVEYATATSTNSTTFTISSVNNEGSDEPDDADAETVEFNPEVERMRRERAADLAED